MIISDTAVEAACEAGWARIHGPSSWSMVPPGRRPRERHAMRLALKAAIEVMKVEGQSVTIEHTPPEALNENGGEP